MKKLSCFSAACLAAATVLHAQSYTAKKVIFNNPAGFTQQQLEDVTGLHSGSAFTAAQLSAAAQRLSDSGYFDSVGAAGDGQNIVFDLKPSNPASFLPVGFENFVWLTRDEIEAAITTKLPLFNDTLPENSPQEDVVNTALTEALAAKSITAKVDHATLEPTLQYPLRALEFRVTSPVVRVANIKLGGVTRDLVPLVQKSVNDTTRKTYDEGLAGSLTADSILAPLLDAGYVNATLSSVSLAPGDLVDGKVPVVVSATLQAGSLYHLSAIHFAGTPMLTADAFTATEKLHNGDVASRKLLLATLAPLDAAYRRQGFLDVIVKAVPQTDNTALTVAYEVSVIPGEPYRMHTVTALGLDSKAQAEFDRGFTMKPGDVYNPDYISNFVKNNTALRALAAYSGTFKTSADPNMHTVDIVITFFKGAS